MTSSDTVASPEPAAAPPPATNDELGRRLDALAAAVAKAEGRIDDSVLVEARELTGRASERLKMSGEHTIVALAGATGSGKSSLFNALTDLELAGVGVRRPTTSWALACAWGPDGAAELLEWMGVPPRHQVSRKGMLEHADKDLSLEGLILLDLPDHDSTEVSHHIEMDRLVTHSDMLIWVLDPQKYADAAIHERYIRKMAGFGAVTMVVLNQLDKIPHDERQNAIADVKRLIVQDGLPEVKVLGVSATRGDGLDELRRDLAKRIREKSAAKARLLADVGDAAAKIVEVGGSEPVPVLAESDHSRLADSLGESAGVPELVDAISDSTRSQVVRRTRWPIFGLFSGSPQSDPLADLGRVQPAATDLAVRDFAEHMGQGLKYPWRSSVRKAVTERSASVPEALDDAIKSSGLQTRSVGAWTRLAKVVQWLLLLAAVVGLGWWLALKSQSWLGLDLSLPDLGSAAGLPNPVWGGIAAVVLGLVIDVVGRLVARSTASKEAARAEQKLRAAIDHIASSHVIAPVEAELGQYAAYRDGILSART